MYKYIGIAAMVAASSYLGELYYERYKGRSDTLGALIAFVDYLKGQIEYFGSPLVRIYRDYKDPKLRTLLDTAEENGLYYALKKHKDTLPMDANTHKLFEEFSKKVGRGTAEEQIRFCESYLDSFKKLHCRISEELPKNRKLYTSIGLMAGILAAILLL
ncbi:MAG: hypothetical protein E7623_07130 [Ruminococcaceae bacterium]|nr:hypothetical protein [Oscillospiraceae bacterium]